MTKDRPLFLVCWSYGTGGIWGLIRARTEREIVELYPELEVVKERPAWLNDEIYGRFTELEYDIDGAPWGLLNSILDARDTDKRRTGNDRPVFLVGQGDPESGKGRWAFLRAHTQLEIRDRYPELTVVHGRPNWIRSAIRDGLVENVALDIDDPPIGLLAEVLARREGGISSPT